MLEPVRLDVDVEPLEGRHAHHAMQLATIGSGGVGRGSDQVGVRATELATGHHDAGRESLDVPLPRHGTRLVEVVEVEQHPTLG